MKLETKLKGRTLRFDGVSAIHPDDIAYFIYRGVTPDKIQSLIDDPTIEQFNEQVPVEDAIKLYNPKAPIAIDLSWKVPQKYLDLDLTEYITDVFERKLETLNYSDSEIDRACERIAREIEQVEERGMVEFMQTVIYIIDKFRETGQVWGVGRGSSCACYLLFLIGLHVVDCLRFDVDMEEFFHD